MGHDVSASESGAGTERHAAGHRTGLFGRLGSGNIGNDATMEAVLAYLRSEQPEAVLDCMCSGPEQVAERYGLEAIQIHWFHTERRVRSRGARLVLTGVRIGLGAVVDAWRTASWVRRHDVVIVPGMGMLESTLPQRPWQMPYSMFLLSLSGRIFGTKVALVSVGASVIHERFTRLLLTSSARLAHYCSFRDQQSLEAARQMGIDGSRGQVYPDLVFALPTPPMSAGSTRTVGVGVMAYFGSTGDRGVAQKIHTEYVDTMKHFVQWLLDTGHAVRLLVGDISDAPVAEALVAETRRTRRQPGPPSVVYDPISSVHELMDQMASLDLVVATRFHNVLVALKCGKPTLAIGYGEKHRALMTQMGVGGFVENIRGLDVDHLKATFTSLEENKEKVERALSESNWMRESEVDRQFAELSAVLFTPTADRARSSAR
jgi:polysaccharide pyruvyl transferase WcaK-like protein